MMKRFLFLSALVAGSVAFGAIRAVTPAAWNGNPNCWQMKRHREKTKEVNAGGAKVVFVGDSITHFWETNGRDQLSRYFSDGDMRMLDLGTSGDRTEHVLWRLTEGGELDGYEAKCVMLMIGTNNTGHFKFSEEPPADTILGIRECLRVIRAKQPKAVVVLTSIFPRGADDSDPWRVRNSIVNREICKFADGKRVFWCDFSDDFLTPEGLLPRELFPDLLHPSALGYEIWHAAVKPYVDYALSDCRLPAPANRYARPRRGLLRVSERNTVYPESRIDPFNLHREGWWLDRLLEKRNQIAASKGEFDLVLFGDSITHFWERQGADSLAVLRKTYSVLDIGYAGDRTQHLIWRAENGELDGYRAKCIMLMIGTNNAHFDAPDAIVAGIRRALDVIAAKQPQAKVLLLPVFPRGASPDDRLRLVNDQVNREIVRFADGEKVIWVDFNSKLLDANGDTLWAMPDRLHPNAAAYRDIWLPAVLPHFQKICGK